ncbi:MAG: dephospho-CoA kinase [Kiritimatiellia bacterium]
MSSSGTATPIYGAIALTGGIACGKSEVAGILREQGVPVLDTDAVGHKLLVPGYAAFEQVLSVFGQGILDEEGAIDRRKLGAMVFADGEARDRLNAILHPAIYHETFAWLDEQRATHRHVVAMVPLLYETGADKRFEKVIVVAADEDIMMRRMRMRGWTDDEALARMKAQMSLREKVRRADVVIWNNEDLPSLKARALEAWLEVTEGKEATT